MQLENWNSIRCSDGILSLIVIPFFSSFRLWFPWGRNCRGGWRWGSGRRTPKSLHFTFKGFNLFESPPKEVPILNDLLLPLEPGTKTEETFENWTNSWVTLKELYYIPYTDHHRSIVMMGYKEMEAIYFMCQSWSCPFFIYIYIPLTIEIYRNPQVFEFQYRQKQLYQPLWVLQFFNS